MEMREPISMKWHEDGQSVVKEWQGSGTILVIDDEPMVRLLVTSVLQSQGFDVLEAEDGDDGLDTLRDHASEVRMVLLDLTMPRMNGESTFLEMKRLAPTIPVVLLSGYSDKNTVNRLMREGPAGFLPKPFKPKVLLEKVREILADFETVGSGDV